MINKRNHISKPIDFTDYLFQLQKENRHLEPETISLCHSKLNKATGGLKPGISLLGGRPVMGKTTFLMRKAYEISARTSVLYCSDIFEPDSFFLRIKNIAIGHNYIHRKRGIDVQTEKTTILGKMLQRELKFCTWNIDHPTCESNIETLVELLDWKAYDVVMLDINDIHKKLHLSLEVVMKSLSQIGEKYGTAILLTLSLSSHCEKRKSKKPKLRDAGLSVEELSYCQLILLLYRPEFYGFEEKLDKRGHKKINLISYKKHGAGFEKRKVNVLF